MRNQVKRLPLKAIGVVSTSTVMLMVMSSEKWVVKTWAAAIHAALAAVASAPKLMSKAAVNVGVMTRRIAPSNHSYWTAASQSHRSRSLGSDATRTPTPQARLGAGPVVADRPRRRSQRLRSDALPTSLTSRCWGLVLGRDVFRLVAQQERLAGRDAGHAQTSSHDGAVSQDVKRYRRHLGATSHRRHGTFPNTAPDVGLPRDSPSSNRTRLLLKEPSSGANVCSKRNDRQELGQPSERDCDLLAVPRTVCRAFDTCRSDASGDDEPRPFRMRQSRTIGGAQAAVAARVCVEQRQEI